MYIPIIIMVVVYLFFIISFGLFEIITGKYISFVPKIRILFLSVNTL